MCGTVLPGFWFVSIVFNVFRAFLKLLFSIFRYTQGVITFTWTYILEISTYSHWAPEFPTVFSTFTMLLAFWVDYRGAVMPFVFQSRPLFSHINPNYNLLFSRLVPISFKNLCGHCFLLVFGFDGRKRKELLVWLGQCWWIFKFQLRGEEGGISPGCFFTN